MIIAHIWYDGHQYALPEGGHMGSNLRAFFGVSRAKHLWKENDCGDDVLVENKTSYEVRDRDKFYSCSKKINQG